MAARPTAAATSSAAIGWNRTGGSEPSCPRCSSAIPLMNSKNWVAWTIEYGIPDAWISSCWVSFARK